VLIASIVVFIIDLLGNSIAFARYLKPSERDLFASCLEPGLFWLRQRVDVSNDDAKSNRPSANKIMGRAFLLRIIRGVVSHRCAGVHARSTSNSDPNFLCGSERREWPVQTSTGDKAGHQSMRLFRSVAETVRYCIELLYRRKHT